jgi:alpha-L-fucosidase 2
MVYMTGWLAARYWERYEYTCDRGWLRARGYPFIKNSALFYLDFLLKAPHHDLPPQLSDGKYHAFPSICGESAMRDPMRLTDGAQVMIHVRHTLWYAIRAAETLGVDEDLRKEWKERLENLPGEWGPRADPYANYLYNVMDPEHNRHVAPYKPSVDDGDLNPAPRASKGETTWYEGHQIRWKIGTPRSNSFKPSKAYANMRRDLKQWTHPNGLVCAMAIARYGRAGAWTETLSAMAPFQEMLLQSWDGAVNVFPRWPKKLDASFRGWRAKGGFIVDASHKDGKVVRFSVMSEAGEMCVVHGSWTVKDASGRKVGTGRDRFGRMCFPTSVGGRYSLYPTAAAQ